MLFGYSSLGNATLSYSQKRLGRLLKVYSIAKKMIKKAKDRTALFESLLCYGSTL